jgi:hypothetical protein
MTIEVARDITRRNHTPSGIPYPHDLNDFVRGEIAAIDEKAVAAGAHLKRTNPSPAELGRNAAQYEAQGESAWIVGFNRQMARMLNFDPRLAGLISFWRDDPKRTNETFMVEYQRMLEAHVETTDPRFVAVRRFRRAMDQGVKHALTIAQNATDQRDLNPFYAEYAKLLFELVSLRVDPLTPWAEVSEQSLAQFKAQRVKEIAAQLAKLIETPHAPEGRA